MKEGYSIIDGKIDSSTGNVIWLETDGSSSHVVGASGFSVDYEKDTNTSGNGYSSTSWTSIDGKVDQNSSDITTISANGDRIETVTQSDALNHEISATQTTKSANGLSTTTLTDENGDGVYDLKTTDQITPASDGSVTELVTTATTGSAPVTLGRTQTYTSADQLTVTTSLDHTGDGVYDSVTKDVTDAVGNSTDDGRSL